MIDNYAEVSLAHEADDLLFGTVESWVAYVSLHLHFPISHVRADTAQK